MSNHMCHVGSLAGARANPKPVFTAFFDMMCRPLEVARPSFTAWLSRCTVCCVQALIAEFAQEHAKRVAYLRSVLGITANPIPLVRCPPQSYMPTMRTSCFAALVHVSWRCATQAWVEQAGHDAQ